MHKQDLRVLKTSRQIDNALLSLLKKTSFDRITVDMLCREAPINRSTFYRHYEDKYDLLNSYTDRVLSDFRSCVKVGFVLATSFRVHDPEYQAHFSDLLAHLYANREIYQTLSNGSSSRDIWNEMSEIVQESIFREIRSSRGISEANEKYVQLYASLFASDLMTIVRWWFEYDGDVTIEDVKHMMNANIRDGYFKAFKEYFD